MNKDNLEREFNCVYNLFITSSEQLKNENFITKAPENIIEKVKKQQKDSIEKIQNITNELNRLVDNLLIRVMKINTLTNE